VYFPLYYSYTLVYLKESFNSKNYQIRANILSLIVRSRIVRYRMLGKNNSIKSLEGKVFAGN